MGRSPDARVDWVDAKLSGFLTAAWRVHRTSAKGHKRRFRHFLGWSALPSKAEVAFGVANDCDGPCVDGSELARKIFTSQIPVGCSHVFGLICAVHMTAGHNALRGSGPGQNPAFDNALALVGCPDRRSTGSALRAVRPANLHIAPVVRRDPVHAASAAGSR